jgi:hypothetical protein
MIRFRDLLRLLIPDEPPFPNSVRAEYEELPDEGLTMGTLFIGRQGTGKTSSLANHLLDYVIRHPRRAVLVLDASGSISDSLLEFISRREPDVYKDLLERVVYDDLANPEWITAFPEFSQEYGTPFEEQVQRVSANLRRLAPELMKGAPYLAGLSYQEIAPQIFRLITAIQDEHGKNWQITEAKKLLVDLPTLRQAVAKYGHRAPEAAWFFKNVFSKYSKNERELRIYPLLAILGAIESREIRARIGYHRPAWTPKEAIEKGLIVVCDGSRLINRESTQHYLFTQVYSIFLEQINRRRPHNPSDLPVLLVLDETYSILSIPGMGMEISRLAPQYRSRKLKIYIVLQELAQLSLELRPHIWSLGNIVCFALNNFDEAYEMAQQLRAYEPQTIKMPARSDTGQPIVEPDRGQYLTFANQLQNMDSRQCIVRRYLSESERDQYLQYVQKTKDAPTGAPQMTVGEIKEYLLRQRGVRVGEALEVVNQRTLSSHKRPPSI